MQLDEPGMGWHAFRRFRNTWLRGRRCQEATIRTLRVSNEQGKVETFSWEKDYLPNTLAHKSVNWGEPVPGFVMFVVKDADFGKIKLAGTVYQLGFTDILGKNYAFQYVGKGGIQPPAYFPGLSLPPNVSKVGGADPFQIGQFPNLAITHNTFKDNDVAIRHGSRVPWSVEQNRFEGNKTAITDQRSESGTAIAPNGIAITGGRVNNPTVNNYGPPAPHFDIGPASESELAPDGQYITEFKLTVTTASSISSMMVKAESASVQHLVLAIEGQDSAFQSSNDRGENGLYIRHFHNIPSGMYTVYVTTKSPETIKLSCNQD
jgi:hypothetical protein